MNSLWLRLGFIWVMFYFKSCWPRIEFSSELLPKFEHHFIPIFVTSIISLFKPSIEEIRAILKSDTGNVIPVFQEISADLITPVSAYIKVAHGSDYLFLFESVAGGEKLGRYSFLGACKSSNDMLFRFLSFFLFSPRKNHEMWKQQICPGRSIDHTWEQIETCQVCCNFRSPQIHRYVNPHCVFKFLIIIIHRRRCWLHRLQLCTLLRPNCSTFEW